MGAGKHVTALQRDRIALRGWSTAEAGAWRAQPGWDASARAKRDHEGSGLPAAVRRRAKPQHGPAGLCLCATGCQRLAKNLLSSEGVRYGSQLPQAASASSTAPAWLQLPAARPKRQIFCREHSLFPLNCCSYFLNERDSQKGELFGHPGDTQLLKTVLQHPKSRCREKPIKTRF